MLQALGISAEAESVYLTLASSDAAHVDDLSERSRRTRDDVVARLEELRDLGLAVESDADKWRTLPLLGAVPALRTRRLGELDAAAAAAESLQNQLIASVQLPEESGVTVLIGRESIVSARRDLCAEARKELCAFDKPPYVQSRPNASEENLSEDAPEWQALERGLGLRCVYHPGFDQDRLAELALFAAKGEQSRTATVPMKLLLVDRQVAMIPSMRSYAPGHELQASIVRHPLIVEALQWLFEAVWDASVPIRTGFSEVDPRRQMLVSLLMTGTTDSAIATQLGVNVRSVRRWISDLMDELGVATRLQLGAALVRSDNLRHAQPARR